MKQCLSCGGVFEGQPWKCPSCSWSPSVVEGFVSFAPNLALESKSYPQGSNARVASAEETCFWFHGRKKIIGSALNRFFPDCERFLEIGCGSGDLVSWLAMARHGISFTSTDIYLSSLAMARARSPRSELLQMDACRIPFKAEFDVIGAFDVLEHLDDDQTVLLEMNKALKAGGGVLLTVPQHMFLWSPTDEAACHKRRYARSELRRKLQAAGFRVLWMSSFVTFLFPLMLASRFRLNRSRRKGAQTTIEAEFSIPRSVNAVFEKILDLEHWALCRSASFPFGGSLVCAGEKI